MNADFSMLEMVPGQMKFPVPRRWLWLLRGVGFTASWPWLIVFALMCVHYACMLGDSAALTAGVIAATAPERRGATMAVYSFSGFTAAFLAPLVFGVVLDLAGGNQSRIAWGLAFASIGIFGVLAPVARWIYARRAP